MSLNCKKKKDLTITPKVKVHWSQLLLKKYKYLICGLITPLSLLGVRMAAVKRDYSRTLHFIADNMCSKTILLFMFVLTISGTGCARVCHFS